MGKRPSLFCCLKPMILFVCLFGSTMCNNFFIAKVLTSPRGHSSQLLTLTPLVLSLAQLLSISLSQ